MKRIGFCTVFFFVAMALRPSLAFGTEYNQQTPLTDESALSTRFLKHTCGKLP
jgi:hypothetical protein